MQDFWRFGASVLFVLVAASCSRKGEDNVITPEPPAVDQFSNPVMSGSDPWVLKKDSFYYYTHTSGNRIIIWKTTRMSKISNASSKVIYNPTEDNLHSENIWAPEIHHLDGKWYVYYTAGSGEDSTQRLWVMENESADPLTGTWVDKGRVFNAEADHWAIDGSVFQHEGSMYLLWSGRPQLTDQKQNLYISRMGNPWTLVGPAVMISEPEESWEINGEVNEAPQFIANPEGDGLVVYSASGCWTDEYCLGMLRLKDGGDPMVASDWTKNPEPIFTKKPENKVFGPGHNGFFVSADGTENWIIYHANSNSEEGCAEKRNIRMQRFDWQENGAPDLGVPVTPGAAIKVPSGE